MKSILRHTLVGFMVLGMMAGTSLASTIDIGPQAGPFIFGVDTGTGGPVTVESRWVATSRLDNVDLGNSAAWPNTGVAGSERTIGYFSSVALQANSTLRFQFTGAAIKADSTMFLLAWDTTGPGWVTVATLNDFTADANGNYTAVRFQVSNSNILAGMTFANSAGTALPPSIINVLPADAVCVLSKGDAAAGYDGLEMVVNQAFAGNVTVAVVEARDNNANPLSAPLAGAENILTVGSYLSAAIQHRTSGSFVAGNATSEIDVEASPSRAKFVAEAAGEDTLLQTSEAGIIVINTAEYGFDLAADDTFTFTLKRSAGVAGVTQVTLSGNVATPGVNQYNYSNSFAGLDLSAGTSPILISVNGTTVLQTGMWQVDLALALGRTLPNEPFAPGAVTLLGDANSHDWTINGSQFIVPYMNSDSVQFGTYIVISNTGSNDALLNADVWTDGGAADGNSALQQTATNVPMGTVYANSTRILLPGDMEAAVNAALGGAAHGRYMIKFIAVAPNDSIHVTAMQNNGAGAGKRSVPVLTDTGHEWKE